MPWRGAQPISHFSQQVWKNILLQFINCLFLWQRWPSFFFFCIYVFLSFGITVYLFYRCPRGPGTVSLVVSAFPFSSPRLIVFQSGATTRHLRHTGDKRGQKFTTIVSEIRSSENKIAQAKEREKVREKGEWGEEGRWRKKKKVRWNMHTKEGRKDVTLI